MKMCLTGPRGVEAAFTHLVLVGAGDGQDTASRYMELDGVDRELRDIAELASDTRHILLVMEWVCHRSFREIVRRP